MRELTFEEMDEVAGGLSWLGVGFDVMMRAIDYAWDHKEEYFEYWLECIGKYPAGPYDYHVAGS